MEPGTGSESKFERFARKPIAGAIAGAVVALVVGGGVLLADHLLHRSKHWSTEIVEQADASHMGEANNGYYIIYWSCAKPAPVTNGKLIYGYVEYSIDLSNGRMKFEKSQIPDPSFRCPQ